MKQNGVWTIVLVIIVGIGAFYGGMKYQQSQRSAGFGQFGGNVQFGGRGFGGQGGQARGNRLGGGRPVMGEVLSADERSITVKLMDGSSKIVLLSDTTTITTSSTGSKSDLKVGAKVGVFGMENADGSVTAQNVQLNPMFRFGGGGPGTQSGQPRQQ